MRIHAHHLSDKIRHSPTRCLEKLHVILPKAYVLSCEGLATDMSGMTHDVAVDTVTVEQHVELLQVSGRVGCSYR